MEYRPGCQTSSHPLNISILGQWWTLQVNTLNWKHWLLPSNMKNNMHSTTITTTSIIILGFTTWACGYFSEHISNSFQQLYTEHKQEFANVWREIANRFKNMPEILGYELMNEPWTGDFYQVRLA